MIFSHVLYQLSYLGIREKALRLAGDADDKRGGTFSRSPSDESEYTILLRVSQADLRRSQRNTAPAASDKRNALVAALPLACWLQQ